MPLSITSEETLEKTTCICFRQRHRVLFGRGKKDTRWSWMQACADLDRLTGRERNGRAPWPHTQERNQHRHSHNRCRWDILAACSARRRLQIQHKVAHSNKENTTTWMARLERSSQKGVCVWKDWGSPPPFQAEKEITESWRVGTICPCHKQQAYHDNEKAGYISDCPS